MADKLTYDRRMLTPREIHKHRTITGLLRVMRFIGIGAVIWLLSFYGARLFEVEFIKALGISSWLGLSWVLSKGQA